MKKRALVFVCMALLALAVVPVINFKLGNIQEKKGQEWWSRAVLYNFDFALPFLNHLFYPVGISTNPRHVIIGKDDWLYLGDQYEKTITVRRLGTTGKDKDVARKIGLATKSWEPWLKNKGVRLFRIILGPDKGTIYPEFLPDWAQPAADSATDTLLANVNRELYIDTRPALRAAKSQFSRPIYYKTDSHWNSLGAWVAFRAFAEEVARTESGLRWISDQQVSVSKVNVRNGGGTANFLRLNQMLRDSELTIKIDSGYPIETEQYDYETGKLIVFGGNHQIDTPVRQPPILVKSKHALNHKKVLWLRDSFGSAMAPFMAVTFTEIVQLHYISTDSVRFTRLIETYKPDYVFITVVERSSRHKWFQDFAFRPSFPEKGKI